MTQVKSKIPVRIMTLVLGLFLSISAFAQSTSKVSYKMLLANLLLVHQFLLPELQMVRKLTLMATLSSMLHQVLN